MAGQLPTDYQTFIALSRYARWLPSEERRETWEETVQRYIDNVVSPTGIPHELVQDIQEAILGLEIMPSMRALMTAGKALDRDNTCGYNCSYLPVDDPKSFDEAMFILLCGTGVGFSVEREYIKKLPEIPEKLFNSETTIVVRDSKEGWAKALRQLLALLWSGEIPKWDMSLIREAGARLETFGGRASGPEPLAELFQFVVEVFSSASGRRLNNLECHDIMCKIGEVVVVGGVRRSAMISLSNLTDDRMRHAKSGNWGDLNPQRALSNNSVAYTEKPDSESFLREWLSLVESKSGERGIFSRTAAQEKAEKTGRRDSRWDFGVNPCSEIILRPYQFCNLTEVVIREDDDEAALRRKVRLATVLGTIQATYTDFPYLRKIWKQNTEEERLLGVSLTGIMDNALMHTDGTDLRTLLLSLKQEAISTNEEWSRAFGIEASAAITCVKPSGTVSQLVNSASGIHARHAPYYLRSVRGDNKDPLTEFLINEGVLHEPDVYNPSKTTVFYFPIASPRDSVFRDSMDAIAQLKLWMTYNEYWCEHKPSITISVKEEEWLRVGAFVYDNFDNISGISFLPHSNHSYKQAPYQQITEAEWEAAVRASPSNLDWSGLRDFEKEDNTTGVQSLACAGGSCELVDIT